MENASKALLMAASVLIGVLLLSLMAYIFLFMSNYAGTVQDNIYSKEIYEFNAQFQQYEGRDDLTAHEVQTIKNLVDNYNSKFENGSQDKQAIKITGVNYIKLEQEPEKKIKYKCIIKYNENTGKINKITINETP